MPIATVTSASGARAAGGMPSRPGVACGETPLRGRCHGPAILNLEKKAKFGIASNASQPDAERTGALADRGRLSDRPRRFIGAGERKMSCAIIYECALESNRVRAAPVTAWSRRLLSVRSFRCSRLVTDEDSSPKLRIGLCVD